jgi:hypothetical protein
MTLKVHDLIGEKVEVQVHTGEGSLYAKSFGVLSAFTETENYVAWNFKDVYDTSKASVEGYSLTFTSLEVDDRAVTV